MRYKYTDEDILFFKENYPDGKWDAIHERFPYLSDTAIYRKMRKLRVKSNNTHRETFDISKIRRPWNEDEDKILIENYSNIALADLLELMPNRSKNSIINHARKLGLISYGSKHNGRWSNEEIKYIKDNWELEPDKLMADKLCRSFRSVKAKREELNLYRRDMKNNSYPTLSKFLRGQNQKWKNDSMENCHYKCVLTGDKDFQIHHLYGVSNIINDILTEYDDYKDKDFSDYSEDDLSFILDKFIFLQSEYPLGECVSKRIHTLFHSMYGQYYNTPDQWYKFKIDYIEGKYEKYV